MGLKPIYFPIGLNAPTIALPELKVPKEKSFLASDAITACQPWIDNRRAKFAASKPPRLGRKVKSIEDEAQDLRNSSASMNHFLQEISNGNDFLIGALAAEMRATIYWPNGRDDKPDDQWNPLLLRMASKANLPLPVYCVPDRVAEPPIVANADLRFTMDYPRISAVFPSEK